MFLFAGEICAGRDRLALGEIEPQLLDRGIEMSRRNMRAASVERGKLLLERGKNGVCTQVAGRSRIMVFQGEIPFCRC